jgi:hypothetical protein
VCLGRIGILWLPIHVVQLGVIATGMKAWQFKLHDGRVLTTTGFDAVHTRWIGPISFEGSLQYSVGKKMWESIRSTQHTNESGLVYHIITLRWRVEGE